MQDLTFGEGESSVNKGTNYEFSKPHSLAYFPICEINISQGSVLTKGRKKTKELTRLDIEISGKA